MDLIGRSLFEVFPEGPAPAQAATLRNLLASFGRVLASGQPDSMPVQHYDLTLPDSEGGGVEERYWSPVNSPCPDLILLDVNLPQADGYELFTRFRRHPLCTTTPVIIVTSSDAAADRQRSVELGAARYFRKPTDLAWPTFSSSAK